MNVENDAMKGCQIGNSQTGVVVMNTWVVAQICAVTLARFLNVWRSSLTNHSPS